MDKFYYLLALPAALQWTVTVPARIFRSQQYSTDISVIKNGFYPTISSGEAGGFIQDCHPHSSYLIPHHASIDMCYRAGNAGSLHGWCVSSLQNHPLCLRVT